MRAHIVVTLKHREAYERCWNSDGGETGMASGWEGAAMIHRRADRDTGWHLVVQQSTDAHP
jgi:hypothetical protein